MWPKVRCVVLSLAMATSAAHATALQLKDQLTLEPAIPAAPTTRPTTQPTLDLSSRADLADARKPLVIDYEWPEERAPRVSGLAYQRFHDISAVAYRTSLGTGLGLASMPGLTVTQALVTREGFHLSLYYVFALGEMELFAPRELPDEQFDTNADRAIGIRMGWKF